MANTQLVDVDVIERPTVPKHARRGRRTSTSSVNELA